MKEVKAIRTIGVTKGQICATISVSDAKIFQKQIGEAIKRTQKGGSQSVTIWDTDGWRVLSIGIVKDSVV